MSNRTLFEFNHDLSHEIRQNPESFAEDMLNYLRSGSPREAALLEVYGVRCLGMRHHSDAFSVDWGGVKTSEPETPKR